MAKTGRNDLCACGSGRKYKRCCQAKGTGARTRLVTIALVAVVLAALLVGLTWDREGSGPKRVWSPEHGHYHDVP